MSAVRTKSSSFITLSKSPYSELHSSPSQYLSAPTPLAVLSSTTYSHLHSFSLSKYSASSSSENLPQPSLSNRSSPQPPLIVNFPTSQESRSGSSSLQIGGPSLVLSWPTIAAVTSTTSTPIFPTEVAITSPAPAFTSVVKSLTNTSSTESGQSRDDSVLIGSVIGSSGLVVLILFVVAACRKNGSHQNNASTMVLPRQSTQSKESGNRGDCGDNDNEDILQQQQQQQQQQQRRRQWICEECENGLCSTVLPSFPPRTTSIPRAMVKNGGHHVRTEMEARRLDGQSGNKVGSMRSCGPNSNGLTNDSNSSTQRTELTANDVAHGRVKILDQHHLFFEQESKNMKATFNQNPENQHFGCQSQTLHPVAAMWDCSRSYVLRIIDSVRFYGLLTSKHDDTTIKPLVVERCGACNTNSSKEKGLTNYSTANDKANELYEIRVSVHVDSPSKSSPSLPVSTSPLPLPSLPNLQLSSGSLLYDWAGSNNISGDIPQSLIQHNGNNGNRNAVHVTETMNTGNRDTLLTSQMYRADSLSPCSSSSIYVQFAFSKTTDHYLEQVSTRDIDAVHGDNKNFMNNNKSSQQGSYQQVQQFKRQEKYWSSTHTSEEIQHPAKVESSTIPDHLLDPIPVA